jgi:hypothetical protein
MFREKLKWIFSHKVYSPAQAAGGIMITHRQSQIIS